MAFGVGAVAAALQLPADVRLRQPAWLAVHLVLLGPATLGLNALRFGAAAWLLGRDVRPAGALRVSVVASAANLLPIPGAALVRIQGLKQLGSGYGAATVASAVVSAVGLVVATGAAGALQLAAGSGAAGGVLLLLAAGGAGAAGLLLATRVDPARRRRFAAAALAIEVGVVVVTTLRLLVVLWAFDVDAGAGQALVLTLAAIGASAVGVVPDGIGLREALAAGLAPLVGLPPSVGFLATAVDRTLGLAVVAPIAFALARKA